MNSRELIRQTARQTLQIEAETLTRLAEGVDEAFIDCVAALHAAEGRVVVTGIGKTAIVARKIVATLNSTGSPAVFLHAADAIHGDLGMVLPGDFVLVLSKSGETAEIKVLAGLVNRLGNTLVAMVGRPDCSLARLADHVLLLPVDREADPNNLAPTASTTAQMALGDALAMSLLALRGFGPDDFARFHPGGSLGKQLYLRVSDLCSRHESPRVAPDTSLRDVILEMTNKRLGATAVADPATGRLLGIITDGDLRRLLSRTTENLDHLRAADFMTASPRTVAPATLAIDALQRLRLHSITHLIVVEEDGTYVGLVHLHDILREGLQ